MELTTLITWNGLGYLLYYGANIAFDYLRSQRKQPGQITKYSYNALLNETPVKVDVPEVKGKKASSAIAREIAKTIKKDGPITLTGPVEDQGIPYDLFMKNSKAFSTPIFK